jgi:hypothetical protein
VLGGTREVGAGADAATVRASVDALEQGWLGAAR